MKRQRKDYSVEMYLSDNEIPARINMETGEVVPVKKKFNNVPEGRSLLKYNSFTIINDKCQRILQELLNHVEYSVVNHMVTLVEFNTNSLRPLNNETSYVDLSERFKVDRRKIKSIMNKLYSIGIYLQISYFSESEQREVTYWVLNPNIAWKGRLLRDSIFDHFKDTILSKLLK